MVWSSGVVPLAGVAVGGVARAGVAVGVVVHAGVEVGVVGRAGFAVEGCRWLRAWEGGQAVAAWVTHCCCLGPRHGVR